MNDRQLRVVTNDRQKFQTAYFRTRNNELFQKDDFVFRFFIVVLKAERSLTKKANTINPFLCDATCALLLTITPPLYY